jgi:type IV secretion system protein VirB9
VRGAVVTTLILLAGIAAQAQGLTDAVRSVHVPYSDLHAIKILAVIERPVLVELDSSEAIEGVVRSNPNEDTWEILPKGHRLLIRATKGARPESVTALTKTRSYLFEVTPSAATPDNLARQTARIVVDPPPPPSPPKAATATPRAPVAEPPAPLAATEPTAAPRASSRKNADYTLKVVSETVDIRPREVFDDGRFTYFRFPANLEIPAIYRSVPDAKEEWIVNFHREGDYLVMQAVSPLWTLRLAGSVLGVFNDAWNPEGAAPINGTTKPELRRDLRR